jgi:hypothetical protein
MQKTAALAINTKLQAGEMVELSRVLESKRAVVGLLMAEPRTLD